MKVYTDEEISFELLTTTKKGAGLFLSSDGVKFWIKPYSTKKFKQFRMLTNEFLDVYLSEREQVERTRGLQLSLT